MVMEATDYAQQSLQNEPRNRIIALATAGRISGKTALACFAITAYNLINADKGVPWRALPSAIWTIP